MKGYIIICLLLLSCGVKAQQTEELSAPIYADPYYCGSCDPEIVWNSAIGEWLFFLYRQTSGFGSGCHVWQSDRSGNFQGF